MAYSNYLFKTEPPSTVGAKPPLFDQLIDDNPHDEEDVLFNKIKTKKEIAASIKKELLAIFNTKTSLKSYPLVTKTIKPTIYSHPRGYGMKDLQSIDPMAKENWHHIGKMIKQTIDIYEPRLKNVKVHIKGYSIRSQSLNIYIEGSFNIRPFEGEVKFPMNMDFGWIR